MRFIPKPGGQPEDGGLFQRDFIKTLTGAAGGFGTGATLTGLLQFGSQIAGVVGHSKVGNWDFANYALEAAKCVTDPKCHEAFNRMVGNDPLTVAVPLIGAVVGAVGGPILINGAKTWISTFPVRGGRIE